MPSTDTQVSRRKWQWLRYWSMAIGGSMVLAAIFWLVCFFIARHRLQTELDAIAARGEPASGSSHIVPPSASDSTFKGYPPFPKQWHEMADATVVDEANALLLAHQAAQYSQTSWGAPFQLVTMNLNQSRYMAEVIADAALQAHETGDDALAFDRLVDLLQEADAISSGHTLVECLTGTGIESLAFNRIVVIGTQMQIEASEHNPPMAATRPTRPVSRYTVQNLIKRLLNNEKPAQLVRQTVMGERIWGLTTERNFCDQETLLRPVLDLEFVGTSQRESVDLQALAQPDWPSAYAILATLPVVPANSPPRYSRPLDFAGVFTLERYVQTEFHEIAVRRIAAISLAVHLYRADTGQWPQSLQDLVPKYLEAIPATPFAKGNVPMRYTLLQIADGMQRPMLCADMVPIGQIANTQPATSPSPTPQFGDTIYAWFDLSLDWNKAPTETGN